MAHDTERIDFPAGNVMLIRDGAELRVLVRPGADPRARWHAAFVLVANGVPKPEELPSPGPGHHERHKRAGSSLRTLVCRPILLDLCIPARCPASSSPSRTHGLVAES